MRVAAGFEEQGNVEDDERRIGVGGEESRTLLGYGRVDDPLQPAHRVVIAQDGRRQLRPVYTPIRRGAGKRRLDRGDDAAAGALQAMHRRVGVEHRHRLGGKHRGNRRLAHTDRAREAEDKRARDRRSGHASSASRSSSSRSRGGATPKNSSNASAAWPISISSPSTVSSPRARAAASRGVSSGE